MIIAIILLNQIDRKKEAYMSTANHLTIRDYFDQVLIGKQRDRKVFSLSSERTNATETGMFHRLLASRQMLGVENANVKSTGLTIVDYLATSSIRCHAFTKTIQFPRAPQD
jgi:hypothetical protein